MLAYQELHSWDTIEIHWCKHVYSAVILAAFDASFDVKK